MQKWEMVELSLSPLWIDAWPPGVVDLTKNHDEESDPVHSNSGTISFGGKKAEDRAARAFRKIVLGLLDQGWEPVASDPDSTTYLFKRPIED